MRVKQPLNLSPQKKQHLQVQQLVKIAKQQAKQRDKKKKE
jgi:hypothetical protein